jgi:hypothetical protein
MGGEETTTFDIGLNVHMRDWNNKQVCMDMILKWAIPT